MKTSSLSSFIFVLPAFFFFSCSDNEDPVPVVASAGESQVVRPEELVTLDGSKSTGPEGFTYSWEYTEGDVPESDIQLENTNSAMPTFIPPKGATYLFELTIKSNGAISRDEVVVTASGGIDLGGALTEDLDLVDIEPGEDVPDYVVTSDLIVPQGITLSAGSKNVFVHFESGTGLIIEKGGRLTNEFGNSIEGYDVVFSGTETGWKGIFVDGGRINLSAATIQNAGAGMHTGQTEAAAVTFGGDTTYMEAFQGNTYRNSSSYDLLVKSPVSTNAYFQLNSFSFKNPVKAPVQFLENYISNYPNIDPEVFDYHIFIPSGANIKDTVDDFTLAFSGSSKYYLEGDLWVGGNGFRAGEGCTIYMKEGAGILSEGGISFQGNSGNPCKIQGLDGADWTGIASLGRLNQINIRYTTIDGAGHGLINIGGLNPEAPAALYSDNGNGGVDNNLFKNIGGFGYYHFDTTIESSVRVVNCTFEGLNQAAIRTNVKSVPRLFLLDPRSNTFNMSTGVPAVLVQGSDFAGDTWHGLGGENFYYIDTHIQGPPNSQAGWTLNPGVKLIFRDGEYYSYYVGGSGVVQPIRINGSASEPVVFDSESGTPGSWGGILLYSVGDGWWDIDHFEIRNGGGFIIPNATEKANVSTYHTGFYTNLIKFTNSTIENSDGWGIVVEQNSFDYGYDDPSRNNIFNNNSAGDVLVK